MRLFSGKISPIVEEILDTLVPAEDIELADREEAKMDLEAVLKEFLRQEREILDEARERVTREGLGYGSMNKVRQQIAKERNFPPPDETLPYILEQLLNMLFHSANVEEIYADDVTLRKKITAILKKHMDVESELDREVRARIKNLTEGTAAFEVEYEKVLAQIRQKKRLD
ncbi:MAG: DUF507 family protein [Myxococcales bacterium]|jgi:hypothetical protein|nr:DUF507 family protein [Myxococcales bacterium]